MEVTVYETEEGELDTKIWKHIMPKTKRQVVMIIDEDTRNMLYHEGDETRERVIKTILSVNC